MRRENPRSRGAGRLPGDDGSIADCREEQAVLVTYVLDGTSDAAVEETGVQTLAESVAQAIEGSRTGELDGFQTRPGSLTLFAYGDDAERLWQSMEPVVTTFAHGPVHVTIRYGWFGAPARTMRLRARSPRTRPGASVS
jgi:hypothetical protein